METKQKTLLGCAFGMPIVAAMMIAAAPAPLKADADCLYAGESYSEGACVESVCVDPYWGQKCLGGRWSSCTNCTTPL